MLNELKIPDIHIKIRENPEGTSCIVISFRNDVLEAEAESIINAWLEVNDMTEELEVLPKKEYGSSTLALYLNRCYLSCNKEVANDLRHYLVASAKFPKGVYYFS
jgi:hypothetical protein